MARLSHSDLQGLLAFLRTCDSFPDVASLQSGMLEPLGRLVPFETAAYHEVNVENGDTSWIIEPLDSMERADHEAFVRWGAQHPIVAYHATHESHAVTLSDFMTTRQLHALELYDEFFAPLEIERQIVIGVPSRTPVIVGIPLNRSGSDFTERERLLLDLLRPHLAQAFRRAQARTQARRLTAELETAAERGGRAVIVLDADHGIQAASPVALRRLHDYFADGCDTGDTLPGAVTGWLRAGPRSPLLGRREGRCASLTFLPAAAPGECDLLLIEEECTGLPPDRLAELGLTHRESEILALADRGLTNHQIGSELGVSPRTVDKHLERVYAKLGVPTRTAALAQARDAAA